jgi:Ca-activated chloride channel family protein
MKRLVLAVFVTTFLGLAAAGEARASGLLLPTGRGEAPLDIASQKVAVIINNGIAVTEITQVFKNRSPRQLEAIYSFPVPREASVSDFSMWIKGKEISGEVLERAKAREIYDSIVRRKKDPGLLEQVSYKLFQVKVFPVPANGEQKIRITYYQPAEYDSGYGVYVYPLETKTRYHSRLTGEFTLTVDMKSEIPLAEVYSPSHKDALVVAKITEKLYRMSVETEKASLDRDLVLVYKLQKERTGIDLVTYREKGEDGFFLFLITPGRGEEGKKAPTDYTLVLDVSGSMAGGGKLDIARAGARRLLRTLGAEDRFTLIAFNVDPVVMAERPVPVTQENLKRADAFLAALQGRGGTDIYPALDTALGMATEGRPHAVVLMSDGRSSGDDLRHGRYISLIRGRGKGSRVFSFGIGNEANRPLLSRVAGESGGYADFISGEDQVERKIALLARKMTQPAMVDLALKVAGLNGGIVLYDVYPERIPDLFPGAQIAIYGRYRGTGPARALLRGKVKGRERIIKADVEFAARDGDNPEIRRMWALKAVDGLLAGIRAGGEEPALRAKVVDLGVAYSIVTPYTSFLVLESEDQYKRFGIARRNAARQLDERAVRDRFRDDLRVAQRQVRPRKRFKLPRIPRFGGGGGGGSTGLFFLGLSALLIVGRIALERKKRP